MRAFISALFGSAVGAFVGVQIGASLMLAWLWQQRQAGKAKRNGRVREWPLPGEIMNELIDGRDDA